MARDCRRCHGLGGSVRKSGYGLPPYDRSGAFAGGPQANHSRHHPHPLQPQERRIELRDVYRPIGRDRSRRCAGVRIRRHAGRESSSCCAGSNKNGSESRPNIMPSEKAAKDDERPISEDENDERPISEDEKETGDEDPALRIGDLENKEELDKKIDQANFEGHERRRRHIQARKEVHARENKARKEQAKQNARIQRAKDRRRAAKKKN